MDDSDVLFEKPTKQELIVKLEEIQLGFRQNLSNLHEKLELLDSRPELQNSLHNLKREAQTRASDLEAEVSRLREELKSIRKLLDLNLDNRSQGKT